MSSGGGGVRLEESLGRWVWCGLGKGEGTGFRK